MTKVLYNTTVGGQDLSPDHQLWAYNGLDCCITHTVYDKLHRQLSEPTKKAYDFERAMLAPALSMVLRGIAVDEVVANQLRIDTLRKIRMLEELLEEYATVIWNKPLNPASPKQLQHFLYHELCIPPIVVREKGRVKVTTDSNALNRIAEEYLRAQPVAKCILALRDLKKDLDVVNYRRDRDGRIRCSYNIAGTKTWRWSSSGSPFYSGGNLQNVTHHLRHMFVPDPGYVMFYADLSNAEGRTVGYLAGDDNYIKAAESGDMHTMTCMLVWADLEWTDDLSENKKIAQQPYLKHTYRDIAKRAGHGTNYLLTAHSLARHTKTLLRDATKFQLKYYGGEIPLATLLRWEKQAKTGEFQKLIDEGTIVGEDNDAIVCIRGAYPNIRVWHDETQTELQSTGTLTTPFGFVRMFWGRLGEAKTLREAVAHKPQSTIGCLLNAGAWNVYHTLERTGTGLQLLAQVHDAILGQVPKNLVDKLMPRVIECMELPLEINGRTMLVPVDIQIGENWKDMKEWKPNA